MSAFEDESVVCDVLDALATKLDGKAAAPEYFARRRRVMHRVLGYAVRKKRLPKNPLSKNNMPEGWTAPEKPEEVIDPRSVGSPALIARMLTACGGIGETQGLRFVPFFGCMYYAMMRPSEVAALTGSGCQLPRKGWGYLTFADSSPAAGRAFTDDGMVHEQRGLKGRTRGRAGQRPAGQSAGCPSRPNSSRCCVSTSNGSVSARTGACSAANRGTSFSRRPGGRYGRKSGPGDLPNASAPLHCFSVPMICGTRASPGA
jgi:hypothetical protein